MGLLATPTDYSLANGLAGAGQGFIQAYKDERDRQMRIQMYQQDREFKKQSQNLLAAKEGFVPNNDASGFIADTNPNSPYNRQQALGAYEKGAQINPSSGAVEPTPLKFAQTQADIAEKNAHAKFFGQGGAGGTDVKRFTQLKDDLDPNKARGGNLAKAQGMINASQRVNALFDQFPDYNVPKAQTSELASAAAAMVNGGSAQSQHQIDSVTPSSLKGDVNGIMSWIANDPMGQGQQAFMRVLHDSAKREGALAQDQVKSAQIQRLPIYKDLAEKNPEQYAAVLSAYGISPKDDIDEKGQYVPKSQGLINSKKNPGGLLGGQGQGAQQQDPDAVKYSQLHNLPYDQALQIINMRKNK